MATISQLIDSCLNVWSRADCRLQVFWSSGSNYAIICYYNQTSFWRLASDYFNEVNVGAEPCSRCPTTTKQLIRLRVNNTNKFLEMFSYRGRLLS